MSAISNSASIVSGVLQIILLRLRQAALEFARVSTLDSSAAAASCMGCCSTLSMNCFDVSKFVFFIVFTTMIPYWLYYKVASWQKWTQYRKDKTKTAHFETIVTAIASMTSLWFLGNYNSTFDWVTALFLLVGMLSFGYVSEAPWARESLNTYKNWDKKLWGVMIGIVLLVVIFLYYHVRLAMEMPDGFYKVYLGCLVIPIILLAAAFNAAKRQNEDPEEKKQVSVHLHHYSIFYALAFFTRFPNLLSRIAAGLVLGCSLHGAIAYAYDPTFEEKPKPGK